MLMDSVQLAQEDIFFQTIYVHKLIDSVYNLIMQLILAKIALIIKLSQEQNVFETIVIKLKIKLNFITLIFEILIIS